MRLRDDGAYWVGILVCFTIVVVAWAAVVVCIVLLA
jgi:hypothetical protein